MDRNELMHYGVLGMKWGIRKDRFASSAQEFASALTSDRKAQTQIASIVQKREDKYDKAVRLKSNNLYDIRDNDHDIWDDADSIKTVLSSSKSKQITDSELETKLRNYYGSSITKAFENSGRYSEDRVYTKDEMGRRIEKVGGSASLTKSIITESEGALSKIASEYGKLEASERIPGYAYSDSVKFLRNVSDRSSFANIEGEMTDYYSAYLDELKHAYSGEILQHHGVLGMKWGIRKDDKVGSRRRGKAKAEEGPESDDHRIAREFKTSGSRTLSNDDLRRLNERLSLEKQYRDLTRGEKSKGQSAVKGVMGNVAKASVTAVGTAAATYLLGKAVAKIYPDFASAPTFSKILKGVKDKDTDEAVKKVQDVAKKVKDATQKEAKPPKQNSSSDGNQETQQNESQSSKNSQKSQTNETSLALVNPNTSAANYKSVLTYIANQQNLSYAQRRAFLRSKGVDPDD